MEMNCAEGGNTQLHLGNENYHPPALTVS